MLKEEEVKDETLANKVTSTETTITSIVLMASKQVSCPAFEYGRDILSMGSRWIKWLDMLENYLVANEYDETETGGKVYKGKLEQSYKARFLLLLGVEAVAVYNSKRKADKSDTLMETIKFLSDHFSPAKNEYAEIAAFGRASRLEGESVNDFLMRLRVLSTHCGFGADLEKGLRVALRHSRT